MDAATTSPREETVSDTRGSSLGAEGAECAPSARVSDLQIKRRLQDELARRDDAVRAGRTVRIDCDRLQPAALVEVADIELERGADLVAEEACPVAEERIHVQIGFVEDRAVRIIVGHDFWELLDSVKADRSLVFPAQSTANGEALQVLVVGDAGQTVTRAHVHAILADLGQALARERLRQLERRRDE